ncbi:MAG: tRNA (adenosine(37)-N6)-threonylcarbamoyltransferase complex dimerization subunit type 1 TsaB [Gammaproteobacteria bacterium]|jgi:tRNA threonylcarbamoyladenosine biosynthesis protein TsaB|nr:tRNA (adenosine(37)-N6)-threonylcarbamoyltransferase complex dimerization subunit type 1 TsaB [Gammaproteobacteria bacterium]
MNAPRILLLDTSSSRCQVGMLADALHCRYGSSERQSAQNILPLIAELVTDTATPLSDLAAIAVMAGPGSFTGLRIGVGVAQALSMANSTPGIRLSNLAALAFAASLRCDADVFWTAMPAREGEFYFAVYARDQQAGVILLGKEQVAVPSALDWVKPSGSHVLVGEGWLGDSSLREALGEGADFIEATPTLETMAILTQKLFAQGQTCESAMLRPNYVKEQLEY